MTVRRFCSSILGLLVVLAPATAAPPTEGIEFFEKKIRPVLVEQCYSCHSTAAKKVKGGLRLDTRDGLLKGGDHRTFDRSRRSRQEPADQGGSPRRPD